MGEGFGFIINQSALPGHDDVARSDTAEAQAAVNPQRVRLKVRDAQNKNRKKRAIEAYKNGTA